MSERFCIPFYVMNSDVLQRIFVVCRGSYCLQDFIVDLTAGPVAWGGGFLHAGVFRTAQVLFATTRNYIKSLSDKFGRRPVTFVGHSLGAGVAAGLCEMYHADFPDMNVTSVVFAPVAAFTRNLSENARARCTAYTTAGDFVPFLSLYNFESLPPGALPEPIAKAIRAGVAAQLENAEMNPGGTTKSFPMYPPGDNYLLLVPDGVRSVCGLRRIPSCTYFGRLVNNLNELRHPMTVYLKWVNEYGSDRFHLKRLDQELAECE
jgi:pimeloyl-ACP methyl ester carboxylesterase